MRDERGLAGLAKRVMNSMLLAGRVLLAAVFAVAAVRKAADREGSRRALERFGVPAALVRPVSFGLPILELVLSVGLLAAVSAARAAAAAAALLLVFCVTIARLLVRGETPDCHCFGGVGSAPVGPRTLVRNLVLVALAGFVSIAGWDGAGMSIPRLVVELGAVAIMLGAALTLHAAFSWQLFKQNGRLLERVSALEAALGRGAGQEPVGQLAIGDRAPALRSPISTGGPCHSSSFSALAGVSCSCSLIPPAGIATWCCRRWAEPAASRNRRLPSSVMDRTTRTRPRRRSTASPPCFSSGT